jgi:hypothetical protein
MSAINCITCLLQYKVACITLLIGCRGKDTFPGQTSVCYLCKNNSAITDPESAEIVCSKCGMVMSDKIDETRTILEIIPNISYRYK